MSAVTAKDTTVHVLALREEEGSPLVAQTTIRAGSVVAGQELWFLAVDGSRQTISVLSVTEGKRRMTLELEGPAADKLYKGVYLFG